MGEAKRKREAMAKTPCFCGSNELAGQCCFNGRTWHKQPAVLGLRTLPQKSIVEKCYMRELLSCDGGISGEHLISQSVMHALRAGGDFSVSGFPWLEEGQEKILSPKNLTANCLCIKHNSALSPLDAAASFFFSGLKLCLKCDAEALRYLVSGHDLERWLLKTVKAFAVSKNFAAGKRRLSGVFASDIEVLEMLDDPKRWTSGAGLYCVMETGETTVNHPRFQLVPITNEREELSGFGITIMGLVFVLMLEAPNPAALPILHGATYRPGEFRIIVGSLISSVMLSREDSIPHNSMHLTHMWSISSSLHLLDT